MGTVAQYKKYKRGIRQANVETDFSSGMMYSEGAIPEGYVKTLVNFDFTLDNNNVLKPRAGHRLKELILPDSLRLREVFMRMSFLVLILLLSIQRNVLKMVQSISSSFSVSLMKVLLLMVRFGL